MSGLALVESPAQLLNVMELAHCSAGLRGVRIAIVAPGRSPVSGAGRAQLKEMGALARSAGHHVCWHDPRVGGLHAAQSLLELAGDLKGIDHLIIGDPYSALLQAVVSLIRPAQITIVDDGTATLEFARQWRAGETFSRWHRPLSDRHQLGDRARTQLADTARRRLAPVAGHRLRVFTAMPVDLPGVDVIRNTFGWVRMHEPAPALKDTADLIGTSLVESGVVERAAYVDGMLALADRYGADRYFAHRRESADKLDQLQRAGLQIVRPTLPLEIAARRGPIGRTVVSLPSTVVHTLPLVLGDSGVKVVPVPVAPTWYAPRAGHRAYDFLNRVVA